MSETSKRQRKEKREESKFQEKEKGNSTKDNSDDEDEHKEYATMARMSNDDVSKSKDYGDSSQLTNWILDSGATCHMLLIFFEVGGSRACVRHVLPTSSSVGQCRLQSVSSLDRLKVGRWKYVFPTFVIN